MPSSLVWARSRARRASMRGRARFGAFNSSKGALRNLAQAMAKEYAEKLGEAGMISIEGIVDGYAYLYRQPANAWSFEVDVRTCVEKW